MALRILCSGHLVRHPLGGHVWHHLQYLVGLRRLGHEVYYFEDYGWPNSCYLPETDENSSDPAFGISYVVGFLEQHGLADRWCFLAEDGTARGMSREKLEQICRDCDVYFNLSNLNWIPELELCRRRVLVDTDPVFTQVGAHGLGGPFSRYHVLTTYGENVHRPPSTMPDGGMRWLPTRQPVVTDLWPVEPGRPEGALTTVTNWCPFEECRHEGRVFGHKDREFTPYFSLPRETGEAFEIALGSGPPEIEQRFLEGGWRMADPLEVTRTPWTYQRYIAGSRGEFSVAKHGYVATSCGWFSDRSAAYLAMGRPVILQDTGFTEWLPVDQGLLSFRTPDEAVRAIRRLGDDYASHCRAARALAEEYFDSERVLTQLLEWSL